MRWTIPSPRACNPLLWRDSSACVSRTAPFSVKPGLIGADDDMTAPTAAARETLYDALSHSRDRPDHRRPRGVRRTDSSGSQGPASTGDDDAHVQRAAERDRHG